RRPAKSWVFLGGKERYPLTQHIRLINRFRLHGLSALLLCRGRRGRRGRRRSARARSALRRTTGRRARRRLPVTGVTVEGAGRSELAELVADHVLRDEDRQELLAVVDRERDAHHLGEDRRATRPGLQHLLRLRTLRLEHLDHQVLVDERTFLNATSHVY